MHCPECEASLGCQAGLLCMVHEAVGVRDKGPVWHVASPFLQFIPFAAVPTAGLNVENVLPLTEAAHAMQDTELLARCRRFAYNNSAAVGATGAVADLSDLGVTKGLLQDAYSKNAQLESRISQLEAPIG